MTALRTRVSPIVRSGAVGVARGTGSLCRVNADSVWGAGAGSGEGSASGWAVSNVMLCIDSVLWRLPAPLEALAQDHGQRVHQHQKHQEHHDGRRGSLGKRALGAVGP